MGPVRIAVAGALCVAAVVAGGWTVSTVLTEQSYPKDMRGAPVVLPQPSEAVREKTDAVAQVAGRTLRVPATGLTVPLGELNEVDGVIDPPGFSSAYLVRNYGAGPSHAASGTVFVVMHSCRGGAVCPGNYLIDVDAGTSSLKAGADVYVAGLHYRVTGAEKAYKPDVHTNARIWANAPGRLVLLTCLQVPDQTESIDNMVITAQLVG
ncbi:class F sortase [Leifsonia sp. L25]|uniref:class F sortase n=1 Tax=Actinomycetes TaxID=1760 RepID=UPI003D683EFB